MNHLQKFIWFFFIMFAVLAQGQKNENSDYEYKLFSSDEMIHLHIYTEIDSLLYDRGEDRSRHPAIIVYYEEDSTKVEVEAQVRVRGNFRRRPENCEFPNFSFFFNTDDVEYTLFHDQKKIKVVAHCNGGNTGVNEYLIYKLYQIHSYNAYKVRVARFYYYDTKEQYPPFSANGFLLENTKVMGKRLNGKILKPDRMSKSELHDETLILNYLFQMMIGNTDWDFELMKNYKYLRSDNHYKIVPVPYDFDLAEVVDAHYPTYESVFGKEPVDRRQAKCLEADKKMFFRIAEEMYSKKKEVYNLYLNFPYLENTRKIEILNYYEEFYSKLKRKRKLYREFKKACKENKKGK